jgi:diaminopimelate epimerase
MKLSFYKFQGTGNDFVIIDNRQSMFSKDDTKLIAFLCDRKFGIGADGLILLENDPEFDFKMAYYNADGRESTMCGNGGRCIVAFAKYLNIIKEKAGFNAVDGYHTAIISGENVSLQMKDVTDISIKSNSVFLDTGSPHHVQIINNLKDFEVKTEGAKLRYGIYGKKGSNINFVEQESNSSFYVRTYERGVEDETLSCGTGVTAVAIAMHKTDKTQAKKVAIETLGGTLQVEFEVMDNLYTNVFLTGPAKLVFKGEINV